MWTKFVKTMAYIAVAVGVIGSLSLAMSVGEFSKQMTGKDSGVLSLVIFLGGSLAACMAVGMTMVTVEISENVENLVYDMKNCLNHLEKISGGAGASAARTSGGAGTGSLHQASRFQPQKKCKKCQRHIDEDYKTCPHCGSAKFE